MSKVSVTIYNIKNNQAKLAFIFKLVQQSLEEEKRLLILVANQQAGEFLDNLLWKNPPDIYIYIYIWYIYMVYIYYIYGHRRNYFFWTSF